MCTHGYQWVLALICLLGACKPSNKGLYDKSFTKNQLTFSSVKPLSIKVDPLEVQHIQLSSLLASAEFIKLESPSYKELGSIYHIWQSDQQLFVQDRNNGKAVIAFSPTGEYLFRLGKLGEGIGEFINPDNVWFIPHQHKIALCDKNLRKVLLYDGSGNFQQEFHLPFTFREFALFDESSFLFAMGDSYNPMAYGNLDGKLLLTDQQFQLASRHFPKEDLKAVSRNFYRYKDGFHFVHDFSDTIYQILPDQIKARYFIDFGEYALADTYRFDHIEKIYDLFKQDKAFMLTNLAETDSKLLFTYTFKGKAQLCMYDKNTRQHLVTSSIEDDVFGGLPLVQPLVLGEKFVFSLSPFAVKEAYKELKNKPKPSQAKKFEREVEQFLSLASKTNNDDNPVLLLLEFRNM